jgi:hypothetical protein
LHTLLDIGTMRALDEHPKLGASWEGFCIEALIARLDARPEQCHYWATHAGAELDLLVVAGGRRRGFEIKRTVAPRMTRRCRRRCTISSWILSTSFTPGETQFRDEPSRAGSGRAGPRRNYLANVMPVMHMLVTVTAVWPETASRLTLSMFAILAAGISKSGVVL